MATLTTASAQWATRPDDQRFLTLDALRDHVTARKEQSWTVPTKTDQIIVEPNEAGGLLVTVMDRAHQDRERQVDMTHWSFSQLANLAGAPASYLRKLPAPLATVNLDWGLRGPIAAREDALVLGQTNGVSEMRAITSQTYGRIWDAQVVAAVERINGDGRWVVPSASYSQSDPKRATTLYASDRDVFIFLIDSDPIEVEGRQINRGFYTWNSEVGAATFGLSTFTYDYVCDNRMIWGASNIKELRIRHTGGAPERFAYEGRGLLRQYAQESGSRIAETYQAAARTQIGSTNADVIDWLKDRGFNVAMAKRAVDSAVAEEGGAGTLLQVVNGITAMARSITHTDERVDMERRAGALLEKVAPR